MRDSLKKIWEFLEVVFLAGAAVFFIRTFIVQPFLVSGASMEPNFSTGHYLLIDEVTYRFKEPARGEVVVFRYPGNDKDFYIKRIVALPGERVTIENGVLKVNGEPLQEGYLPVNIRTVGADNLTLAEDEYFVLGDNRYYSFDSRNWGPLKSSKIIGLVRLRLFPIARAGIIAYPHFSR